VVAARQSGRAGVWWLASAAVADLELPVIWASFFFFGKRWASFFCFFLTKLGQFVKP
jgi:hypothetical protein